MIYGVSLLQITHGRKSILEEKIIKYHLQGNNIKFVGCVISEMKKKKKKKKKN